MHHTGRTIQWPAMLTINRCYDHFYLNAMLLFLHAVISNCVRHAVTGYLKTDPDSAAKQ